MTRRAEPGFRFPGEPPISRFDPRMMADVDPESEDGIHLRGKVTTAKFHAFNMLPDFWGKAKAIEYLDKSLLEMPFPNMV